MDKTENPISELILQRHGIDISKYDHSFLKKSLQKRITETRCSSAEDYCTLLAQNDMEVDMFLQSLNNSYTEFFRNPLTFAVLERIILPSIIFKRLKSKRKEIRIWSTACAAGQEIYSLAMLLEENKNNGNEKINFRIFATDQSESQVIEAQKGHYSDSALNNMNLKRINLWFTKYHEAYTINQELKKKIDFSVFNLFNENFSCPPASIFGDFDLIICANILFYYKPEYQKVIIQKIGNCLADGGYLITGETEREILARQNFREVFPQSAIFLKVEHE